MTRKEDLRLFEQEPGENPYHRFYLLENPFPGYGEKPGEVCTNQIEIKTAFVQKLRNFETENKRLRIDGLSGAGKTNILRYFERLTDDARMNGYIKNIKPIYVLASVEDYIILHGQIVDELLKKTFTDLIGLLRDERTRLESWRTESSQITEVSNALFSIVDNTLLLFGYERAEDAFQRWLKGQKTTTADRRFIRIEQDIGNPSIAIRYLQEYLQILRDFSICDGIVLLIDEFEAIFESLTKAKESRFAQDLRHLIDTLESHSFFIFATTPEPGDLSKYPVLERRMGSPILLKPINDIEEANQYALDYLKAGREAFEIERKDISLSEDELIDLSPLESNDIQIAFETVEQKFGNSLIDNQVLPGYFLPELRRITKERVEEQS